MQIYSPSMKAVIRTCTCAVFLGHLDFRLFMFGSHLLEIRMHCQFYFETEVRLPIFRGSYSNLELMQILLIICIAVMVNWQYFLIKCLYQDANLFPINEGSY